MSVCVRGKINTISAVHAYLEPSDDDDTEDASQIGGGGGKRARGANQELV